MEKAVIPTDFFGRQIAPKAKTAGEVKNSLLSNDIWFKFKEGYSNAVRRTIRLQDLVWHYAVDIFSNVYFNLFYTRNRPSEL